MGKWENGCPYDWSSKTEISDNNSMLIFFTWVLILSHCTINLCNARLGIPDSSIDSDKLSKVAVSDEDVYVQVMAHKTTNNGNDGS